jgi:hypothetical protein
MPQAGQWEKCTSRDQGGRSWRDTAGRQSRPTASAGKRHYATGLRIPAGEGNHGATANQRGTDPHWQVIDVLKVDGLRP